MCNELCTLYVDTEHVGTLVVTAYRIEASSDLCPSQESEQEDYQGNCNYDAYLNISRYVVTQSVGRSHSGNFDPLLFKHLESLVLNIELLGIDDRGHAFREEESRECDYERLNVQICNEESLNKSESESDGKCDEQCDQWTSGVIVLIRIEKALNNTSTRQLI